MLSQLSKSKNRDSLSIYNKEKRLFHEIESVVCELYDALIKEGLHFIPMKTFREYDYTDYDVDIIIVNKDKSDRYVNVLRKLGYALKRNVSILREPYKRHYVRSDASGVAQKVKVHLHYLVSWNALLVYNLL